MPMDENPGSAVKLPSLDIISDTELRRIENKLKTEHAKLFGEEQYIDRKFGFTDADLYPGSYFHHKSEEMPHRFSPEFHAKKAEKNSDSQAH